jgi:hypothetical protein
MGQVRKRGGVYCLLEVTLGARQQRDSRNAHDPHAIAALIPRGPVFCVEGARRHRREQVAAVSAGGSVCHGIPKYLGMERNQSVGYRTEAAQTVKGGA